VANIRVRLIDLSLGIDVIYVTVQSPLMKRVPHQPQRRYTQSRWYIRKKSRKNSFLFFRLS